MFIEPIIGAFGNELFSGCLTKLFSHDKMTIEKQSLHHLLTPIQPGPPGWAERHGIVSNHDARHCAKEFFIKYMMKNSFLFFEAFVSEKRKCS